jgi:REP element-mobilizing transposase RayT
MIRPRSLILAPGGTYHVAARGNRRADIVMDDTDRRSFIANLGDVIDRFGWQCHAYCLLTNHYHLLVETPKADLPAGMYLLNRRHAERFNRRHELDGHVFQRRYFAELIETHEHFLALAAYIDDNPVRAGLCEKPEDWPWSGCAATLGLAEGLRFFNPDGVLRRFSLDAQRARVEYALFLRDVRNRPVPRPGRGTRSD